MRTNRPLFTLILCTSSLVLSERAKALSPSETFFGTPASTFATPQSMNQAEVDAAADAAYKAKDWPKTATLYEQLLQSKPTHRRYLYRLGVALQATGQHQKALETFEKSQANGTPVMIIAPAIAGVYASMGQTEKAFEQLTAAVAQGFNQPDQLASDPDLQPLRSDARFAGLVAQAKHNQRPCADTAEDRQFDFWVGDWNVESTKEQIPQGLSHVERTLGDCVIWENWTSLNPGYEGKSYNIYNPNLKRWEQYWVDNVGGVIFFYGNLSDGVMDYFTDEIPQPDGTKLKRHLQFFNLGADKVRQFSQGSTDGGKTWSVEYDFTYNRQR